MGISSQSRRFNAASEQYQSFPGAAVNVNIGTEWPLSIGPNAPPWKACPAG
jgi:hypothetical protein